MSKTPWRNFTVAIIVLLYSALVSPYSTISDDTLKLLPRASDDFDIKTGLLLSPLLRTRVPGSEGNAAAQQHFADFFRDTLPKWKIEFQNSTQKTPVDGGKKLPFRNFIASRDPPWASPGDTGRLTLVAHYDSLIKPKGFIGAIDSAAPCAMIMHAVRTLDAALTKKWEKMQDEGVDESDTLEDDHKGIQVIFLDGEEAFVHWNAEDSIYGARSLAEQWDTEYHPAMSTYQTRLDSISLFVLLDLLGSGEYTPVPSWFRTTHWAYQYMAKLESRLRDLDVFKSKSPGLWLNEADKSPDGVYNSYFMQDDHLPFIARGVEVLHLIPAKFPEVWHEITDDGEHLDMPTVEDWAILTMAFAAEWFELEGFFDAAPLPAAETGTKEKRHTKEYRSKSEL
ncbi:MAG: hypothetical protein Q9160_004403 [Pyrenula sp. 1 TL-2023]